MLGVSFWDSYGKLSEPGLCGMQGPVLGRTALGPCRQRGTRLALPVLPTLRRGRWDGDGQWRGRHQLVIVHACGTALSLGIGCYAESLVPPAH